MDMMAEDKDQTATDKDKDTTSDKTTTDDKDNAGKDTGKTTTTDEDEDKKHQLTDVQDDSYSNGQLLKNLTKLMQDNNVESRSSAVTSYRNEQDLGASTYNGLLMGEYLSAVDLGGNKLEDIKNWYISNPVAVSNENSTSANWYHLTYQGFDEATSGPQPKMNTQEFTGRDGAIFNSVDFQPRKLNERFLLEFNNYTALQNAKRAIYSAFYQSQTAFRQRNMFVHVRNGNDYANSRAFYGFPEPFQINPPAGQHWVNFVITIDMIDGYYQGFQSKNTGDVKLGTTPVNIDIDSDLAIDPYFQDHWFRMKITPEQSGPLEIRNEMDDGPEHDWVISYSNAVGGSTIWYDGINSYDGPDYVSRHNMNGTLGSNYGRFLLNVGSRPWVSSGPCVINIEYYPLYWY